MTHQVGPIRDLLQILPETLRPFQHDILITIVIRHTAASLHGMKICEGCQHRGQFRDIVKSRKTCRQPVRTGIHIHLKLRMLFRKHPDPAVEILQFQRRQLTALQIALHDKSICYTVCDRRSRCKDDTLSAILMLHDPYFFHHIIATRGSCLVDPQHILCFGHNRYILKIVRLIQKKTRDPQLVKTDAFRFFFRDQFCQLLLQFLDLSFQTLRSFIAIAVSDLFTLPNLPTQRILFCRI